jgi:hypothetical protein
MSMVGTGVPTLRPCLRRGDGLEVTSYSSRNALNLASVFARACS